MVQICKMKTTRFYHNKLRLATIFLMINSLQVWAQTIGLGSWNILNIKYAITNNTSMFGEAQLRSLKTYNHFHYYEYKGGLSGKLSNQMQVSLGLGRYVTYAEGGNFVVPKNNDEFRIWPMVTMLNTHKKNIIEHRYRMESRFTSNGYRNRFRYRLMLNRPITIKNLAAMSPAVLIGTEIFLTDVPPYFERNRFNASLNIKASKMMYIQAGYLYQFDYRLNDEIGRNFFQIAFIFELKREGNMLFNNQMHNYND